MRCSGDVDHTSGSCQLLFFAAWLAVPPVSLSAQVTTGIFDSAYAERTGLQSVATLASAWASLSQHLDRSNSNSGQSTSSSSSEAESLILSALKLTLASLGRGRHARAAAGTAMRPDGRDPQSRAVDLGVMLADLSSAGIPLDAEAIAAGIVLEAVSYGGLGIEAVLARLGPGVATLVHDTLRVRSAPDRVELYDDEASR